MRLRVRIGLMALSPAIIAGGFVIAGLKSSSAGASSPTLSESQIQNIALGFAAYAGDPSPTLIEHVAGARSDLVKAASGDIVQGSNGSYLILLEGNFVLQNAPRPPGSPAPQGTVATLVVDAQTAQITDVSVSDNPLDLSSIGPVTVDS